MVEKLPRPQLPAPVQGGPTVTIIVVGDKKIASQTPNVKVEGGK